MFKTEFLEIAIKKFNENRTEENLFNILTILSDVNIIIPCSVVMDEADEKEFEKMLEDAENPDELVGKTFTNKNAMRLIPDVLTNGQENFFPVFTSAEQMGEYGNNFSKIEKPFCEAITLAKNNPKGNLNIVINAFSEMFILKRGLYDLIINLKERM